MVHLFGIVKYLRATWTSTTLVRYAAAIKNRDGNFVSHAPKNLLRLFHKLLKDSGNLKAEYIGNRLNVGKGNGVEIPGDVRLLANDSCLGRLKRKLSLKDFTNEIVIKYQQKSTYHRMAHQGKKSSLFIF